LEGLL